MLPLWILMFSTSVSLISSIEIGDKFPENEIPNSYQLKIQTSSTALGETSISHEYYDGDRRRMSIISWKKDGKKQRTIQQINETHFSDFTVTNDITCNDFTYTQDAGVLMADVQAYTQYLFSFLRLNMTLRSKTINVIGINCQEYGMDNVESENGPMNLTMFWSANDSVWQFPYCPNKEKCSQWWVPVKSILNFAPDVRIENLYYEYKNYVFDQEVFQVPRGVSCQGTHASKPLPILSDHFQAGIETYFPHADSNTTTKEQIYFNIPHKLVRVDYYFPADLIGGMDTQTNGRDIIDYETNVVYSMDLNFGNCTIKNIDESSSNSIIKIRGKSVLDSLLDTQVQLFYVGQRTERGRLTDVWVSNLTDEDTFIEIYFVNETILDDSTNMIQDVQIPLVVNQTSKLDDPNLPVKEAQVSVMSFFNYRVTTLPWKVFDVTSCFGEESKYRFQMELKGNVYQMLSEELNEFIHQMRTNLANKAEVRQIRFQEILVDYMHKDNETTVFFTTTLLEDPHNANNSIIKVKKPKTNQEVYNFFDNSIYDYDPNIFTIKTASGSYKFKAVGIRDDIVKFVITGNDADEIDDEFTNLGAMEIKGKVDLDTTGLSRKECLENCKENEEFRCESFSYCRTRGRCILSTYHIEEKENNVTKFVPNDDCEIYSRNYINDYVPNFGQITAAVDDEKTAVVTAENIHDCSRKCSINTPNLSFYCEGFDACKRTDGKVTCSFRSRHILEMKPSDISYKAGCNHYTRNYLGDFIKLKDKSVALSKFKFSVQTTNVENCARFCTSSSKLNYCKAFEMCQLKADTKRTECRLLELKDDSNEKEAMKVYDDSTCDHYPRQRFVHKGPEIKPTTLPPPAERLQKSGYSKGSMVGLAFGLLFLGLILGVIMVMVIMKYKIIHAV